MNTARAKSSPNPDLWIVTADPDRALQLGKTLDRLGMNTAASADLEHALAADPEVVVVDPSGWEESCRHILEGRPAATAPPPAILFCGPDRTVLARAGPAFGFVSSAAHPRELATGVAQARRAHREFRRSPRALFDDMPGPVEQRLKAALARGCALEIRADRNTAFYQAVGRRMLARLIPRLQDYADVVERSKGPLDELELLAQCLLVGETYFWRYAGQFQSLQTILIPELAAGRPDGERRIRLWSAGCSTGEEVYSLAIACLEAVPADWAVEIRGTDLDRAALARAESGLYGQRALRNLPRPLQHKYLEPEGEQARIKEALRRSVRFEFLNLGTEQLENWTEESGPFDAIFCRNTLIYFPRREAARMVAVFGRALVRGGGLFLGASETVHGQRGELEPVRAKGSFFFRKLGEGEEDRKTPAPSAPRRDPLEVKLAELYGKGISHAEAEDFAGAGKAFAEIVELRPRDARGHTGMGLLLANQGREVEALQHLEQAEKGDPPLAETAYLLGLVQERSGRDGEALQHYEIALQRDSQFFMAHVNRAWILKRLGRRERFLSEMRAAFAILRRKPQVLRWVTGGLGWEALLELVADTLEGEGESI